MRTMALAFGVLLMGAAFLAIAPAAEARQVCTYGTGDPCDDELVCAWDRINGRWVCAGHIDECWFRCW